MWKAIRWLAVLFMVAIGTATASKTDADSPPQSPAAVPSGDAVVAEASPSGSEAPTIKYYTISGKSNDVGWSISISFPNGSNGNPNCGPVAKDGNAAALAAAFVDCVNGSPWTGSAMLNPADPDGFCLTCPTGNFDLGVGEAGAIGKGKTVGASGQPFNASVFLVGGVDVQGVNCSTSDTGDASVCDLGDRFVATFQAPTQSGNLSGYDLFVFGRANLSGYDLFVFGRANLSSPIIIGGGITCQVNDIASASPGTLITVREADSGLPVSLPVSGEVSYYLVTHSRTTGGGVLPAGRARPVAGQGFVPRFMNPPCL